MPLIINTNAAKAFDKNGNHVSFDTVADMTSQERIDEINAVADEAISQLSSAAPGLNRKIVDLEDKMKSVIVVGDSFNDPLAGCEKGTVNATTGVKEDSDICYRTESITTKKHKYISFHYSVGEMRIYKYSSGYVGMEVCPNGKYIDLATGGFSSCIIVYQLDSSVTADMLRNGVTVAYITEFDRIKESVADNEKLDSFIDEVVVIDGDPSENTKVLISTNSEEIQVPSWAEHQALDDKIESNKQDLTQLRTLLEQVRDALKQGDIDRAIDLLDTFLLDEGVLV